MKIDLSIIIVNYNTYNLTCQCIESIYKETYKIDFEIILIDNASTECDSKNFLDRFPNVILLQSEQNVGFGRANNMGMDIAKGKYFLLLNSDCIVLDRALDKCVNKFNTISESDPTIGTLGCKLVYEDLSDQKSFFGKKEAGNSFFYALENNFLYKKSETFFCFLQKKKDDDSKKSNPVIGGLYGAFIMLRKDVYKTVGGFDPDFFMYCEETEWFRGRINKRYKTIFTDVATVIHIGGGSSDKEISDFALQQNIASYFLYWYKMGKWQYMKYTFITYLSMITNLLFFPFLSNISKRRVITHFKIFNKVTFGILKYKNSFGARKTFLKVV